MKRLTMFAFAAFAVFATGQYLEAQVINNTVAVCNPSAPSQCAKPDSNGALPVTMSGGGSQNVNITQVGGNSVTTTIPISAPSAIPVTGSFTATTTALTNTVAPSYTDGTTNPLSTDLNGQLRVTGTFSANSTANASSSAPTYTAGAQPLSQDLSGNLRTTLTTALPTGANTIGAVTVSGTPSVSISGTPNVAVTNTPNVAVTSIAAGSNIIGNVRIDQTTPGTTNGTVPNGNVADGATDSGNPLKVGALYTTSLPTYTSGQRGTLQVDSKGSLRIAPTYGLATASDSVANTSLSTATSTATNGAIINYQGIMPFLFNGSTWDRQRMDTTGGAWVAPGVTSGTSNFSLIAAATTNSTSVKASAGVVTEITAYNNSGTIAYLKLYNSASAPTCGSGTPVARYLIPASTSGAGTNVDIALGKTFSTGIAFCITGAIADADTTAVAASTYIVNMTYK